MRSILIKEESLVIAPPSVELLLYESMTVYTKFFTPSDSIFACHHVLKSTTYVSPCPAGIIKLFPVCCQRCCQNRRVLSVASNRFQSSLEVSSPIRKLSNAHESKIEFLDSTTKCNFEIGES